jgi:hypothetical protein
MNEKTQSALDEIVRKRKETQAAARAAAAERKSAEDAFLEQFTEHCAAVIRPTMTAFGDYLTGHDCPYEIESRDQSSDGKSVTSAAITVYLFPGGRSYQHRLHEYPMLSVIAEPREQKVRLHQSTMAPNKGGQAGSIGSYPLEQLTPEFLEERLVGLAREALR